MMNSETHIPAAQTINFDEFYNERVASFDKERNLFDHYLRLIKPEQNEAHGLEWESRSLQEESRLARQAAESVEERLKHVHHEIASVSREIQELQHAAALRNEQIKRLSHLARPVCHDVTYIYKDIFPAREMPAVPAKSPKSGVKAFELGEAEHTKDLFKIIKTGEVVKLERRIQEETIRATSHLHDLRLALQEAEEERSRAKQQHQILRDEEIYQATLLWKEADHNELQCYHAVSELLRLRHRILIVQRREIEELEQLQKEKEAFLQKEGEVKRQCIESLTSIQLQTQHELKEVEMNFKQQLLDLENELKRWRKKERKLAKTEIKVGNKEVKLQGRLKQVKERYIGLKRRNALEMEGYRNQVRQLKQGLKHLDRTIQRAEEFR
jgi:coiled-coil domain-containing protein 77